MERTTQIWFGIVVAAIAVGTAGAMCPLAACNKMMHPEMCRVPTYMIYERELCKQCTQCIMPSMPMDEGGCPMRPCPMIAFPPGCAARSYFMWNGMMCPDCDINMCKGQ